MIKLFLFKKKFLTKQSKGFTLIELLVVVAIISLLASIVLASLNSARAKANDARRRSDIKQIQTALELYFSKCGTYVVKQNCTNSIYGSGGSGRGWFNYVYPGYNSISQGLIAHGVVGGDIADPSGNVSTSGGYMVDANQSRYTIWAKLQNPSAEDIATMNNCFFSTWDNPPFPVGTNYFNNICISN